MHPASHMPEGFRPCVGKQWGSGHWFMSLSPDTVVGWSVSVPSWNYLPPSELVWGRERLFQRCYFLAEMAGHEKIAAGRANTEENYCLGES